MTHTPGPWRATFTATGGNRGVRAEGGYVCFLLRPTRYSNQDERYERELEEAKANARLIAAAPEMLAALKASKTHLAEMWEAGEPWENIEEICGVVGQAIADVEGGE